MRWRAAQYEDLHRIVLADTPDMDVRGNLPDNETTAELLGNHSRTWEKDGRPIAIIGIAPMWKGVGTCWTLLSEESKGHGFALTRSMYRVVEELHEERGYWRLQATVMRGDEPSRLWAVQLGFRYEGTMVAYGPDGSTHDMYARVRL